MSTQKPAYARDPTPSIRSSILYKDWYYRVGSGKPNDYIIAISADPRFTGVSGSGKTTLGTNLAKYHFDISESGFNAKKQATLDPYELAYDAYENSEEGSCLIYDEAQGTPSSTGLNSKRSMNSEVLEAINTVATRRMDRKTLIVITQSLKSLTKDLFDFIDAWLLITDDVNYVATHYGVHPDVFDLESRKTKTPGIETISWDPLPADDPDYQHLTQLKKESLDRGSAQREKEQELPKEHQIAIAQEYRNMGWSLQAIADDVDAITFSREWIRNKTEAPDEGVANDKEETA